MFDLGITGRDWIEETGSEVVSLGELQYSKASARPVRIVVAIGADSPIERVEDLPQGVRVATEYPGLTRRFFEKKGIDADIRLSLRRDRGEGARDRRLHRRSDRDGPGAQGRGPEDHRLDPDVAHRADREPGRL